MVDPLDKTKKKPKGVPVELAGPPDAKWKYMCIRSDVHARLDRDRLKRAQAAGFKLSWNKYFILLANELDQAELAPAGKAARA